MKKTKAITLVALIITIVVLLILATVTVTELTGNGIIAKTKEAAFRAEMAEIREQIDSKILKQDILNASNPLFTTHPTNEEVANWDGNLKREIIYWGQVNIGVNEITKEYATAYAEEIFRDYDLLDRLYYVDSVTAGGKTKTYLYDQQADIVYKIPKTTIGLMVVHSIEELNNNRGIEPIENIIDIPSSVVTVGQKSYFEPDLEGFNIDKTSIIYYEERDPNSTSEDPLGTLVVPYSQYLENGKQRQIRKNNLTYTFYDYEKQMWGNILIENSTMKSYWVWIPRYAYNISGDTTNIVFMDLESEAPEGYILHSDFSDGKKGIWVSKYEPISTANTVVANFPYYIPDLTGFDPDKTYIEVYNSSTQTFTDKPLKDINNLAEFARNNNWFDYQNQQWANIKVVNDQGTTEASDDVVSWWVWIPRYAYNITGDTTSIIFIDLQDRPFDGSTLPSNYIVHSAFEDNKKGIWVSKYEPINH